MAAADAELVRARLLTLSPEGFEEVELGELVELAVYTDEEGKSGLEGAIDQEVSSEAVPLGWEERWRTFHGPAVAGGIWIGPPWLTPPPGQPAVVVDPGRAFGTGAHPTTRACIELLSTLERGSVLDAGTGSGVIAAAAVRLGFDPVFAMDSDPAAIEAALGTARRNRVCFQVQQGDVGSAPLPAVDLVVANIERGVVERLLRRQPSPRALTSGYLVRDVPTVEGWEQVSRLELDGWAADVLIAGDVLS